MNSKNTTYHALLLAILLMPITLLAQKEITKTFNGIKRVRINTASGSAMIKKSDSPAVTLRLQYTYDDDDYTATIVQEGDELVAKEKFHKNSSNGSASWTLTIPNDISVKFVTGSGDIEVAGLSLKLEATTGSGEFVFTGVSGDVECTTGSGDIDLENVSGELKATSGSGSFNVSKSKGSLKLTSGSGNHRISESSAEFDVTTGSGRINATGISTQGSSSFTAGSGNVEVQLSTSPAHDLTVTSGSGNAVVNFNGNAINGEIVMRASKKHGYIEAPFAFDKTEEISNHGNDITIQKTALKGTAKPRISISTGSGSAVLK